MSDQAANVKEFNANITAFAEAMRVDSRLAYKRIIFDIWRRIIKRSPVDTGRFRASWTINQETPDETVQAPDQKSYSYKATFDESKLNWTQAYPMLWINNSLPYAERLETGWSKQAPSGVVGLTILEITTFINNVARRGNP